MRWMSGLLQTDHRGHLSINTYVYGLCQGMLCLVMQYVCVWTKTSIFKICVKKNNKDIVTKSKTMLYTCKNKSEVKTSRGCNIHYNNKDMLVRSVLAPVTPNSDVMVHRHCLEYTSTSLQQV